ncbi:stage VI sporulation protein D [Metabacillus sediminilitoris]|uniref:stage VI sporulation protein D n=1 Tax=Metabacillus sediminilitoris TaxID=2567941 RepID=UPI001454D570|nr:stage VI sporulation protein D [Metabacillus sediminilitoris]
MSQEQQQLRFSVEESVWFQKGQEVSELLSISLDPDISIHEHEQYISIRGALLLTGEYKIDTIADVQDQFEYANVRYVNEVTTREDGVSEINHRFPVDITIPNNRIENLEEVYVSIESFDYEIPEVKCLKLIADLSISGITNEQIQPVAPPEVETQEEETFEALYRAPQQQSFDEEKEQTFQFQQNSTNPFSSFYQEQSEEDVDKLSTDASKIEQDIRAEENSVEEIIEPAQEEKVEVTNESNEVNQEVNQEINKEEVVVNEKQQEELYEPFIVEVRKEEQMTEDPQPQEVHYSFFSKSEELESTNPQEAKDKEVVREDHNEKDAHYLTSLFARDGEEDFSRLKMCIVQQGETIELISERYDISVQQILRVNNFNADQDVYEGQILYIPAYSTSK